MNYENVEVVENLENEAEKTRWMVRCQHDGEEVEVNTESAVLLHTFGLGGQVILK